MPALQHSPPGRKDNERAEFITEFPFLPIQNTAIKQEDDRPHYRFTAIMRPGYGAKADLPITGLLRRAKAWFFISLPYLTKLGTG
ncbi:MAG: hypothetical protein DU429_07680 [Candidatus Tokpelaia sp.]|nr:MAG: hypothetical protein DU429_07680 [Candidatus Tokpelaia sp.]KAA6206289.1 MAG: hypothetical protein DU430_01865 [Candidatus Tokpelaia sp.]KAA6406276.1 hypothetical protein DPQ22_00185 [Candidatus Tokpelaia sp.]